MPSQAQKFKIGLLVVASLAILVVTVIWLGASRWFQESQKAVAYFVESVQGLETGSQVKFRGVPVGTVSSIRMAPDAQHIEVVMSLQPGFRLSNDVGVKMALLGITGKKYLELNRYPEKDRREPARLSFRPRYQVIVTYPTDIKEWVDALEKIFQKVNAVDVERISKNLVSVSGKLDKLLGDSEQGGIVSDAAQTMKELKQASKRLNQEIHRLRLSKRVGETLDKTTKLLNQGTRTVRSAEQMVRRADINVNRTLGTLDKAADNILKFTRMILEKPRLFIWGSPPKDVKE